MALYQVNNGDVCLITVFGRLFGQTVMNTFHYKYLPSGGQSMPDGPAAVRYLCTMFRQHVWAGGWSACVSDSYFYDKTQGQIIYPSRRVYEVVQVSEVGQRAGEPLPPANSACLTRVGSIPGRGRSASLQVAGMINTDSQAGVWTNAAILLLNGLANAIPFKLPADEIETEAWEPVNWSVAKAAETNVVRYADPQRSVRTEKRRVVGRGI